MPLFPQPRCNFFGIFIGFQIKRQRPKLLSAFIYRLPVLPKLQNPNIVLIKGYFLQTKHFCHDFPVQSIVLLPLVGYLMDNVKMGIPAINLKKREIFSLSQQQAVKPV